MNWIRVNSLRRGFWVAIAAPAFAVLTACSGDCVLIGNGPSIVVTVVDAATGIAPTTTAMVRVSDGTTEESAIPNDDPHVPPRPNLPKFSSRSREPGLFRVTVTAGGYQTFVRDGIRVNKHEHCGWTQTAEITTRLQPDASL